MAEKLGIIHGGKSGSDTKVYIDNVKQDDVTKVEITNKKGSFLLNLTGNSQNATTSYGEYVPLVLDRGSSTSRFSIRLVSLKDYSSKIITTSFNDYAENYACQYFDGFLFEVGNNYFYKYDITNNLWSDSIRHSIGRRPQSLYVKDNNLYAKNYTELYRYNGNNFILEDSNYFPSNTSAKHYYQVAIINNELYVYYKYDSSNYAPTIAKKTNDGWQELANYPSARSGIFEYEGKLAGFNGYNNNLYIYNENANTWDSIGILENINYWNNSSASSLSDTKSHSAFSYKGTVFFDIAVGTFDSVTNERKFISSSSLNLGLFAFPGRETNLTYKNQE